MFSPPCAKSVPRGRLVRAGLALFCAAFVATSNGSDLFAAESGEQPRRPNIVFILADDLGYGDLGCYGQRIIQTPHLDRMAAEGLRFTQFYAGSTVCAPSRSVLMTGQHVGHTRVRGNSGKTNPAAQMLRDADVTVAEVLHSAGYHTGLIGKWGLGLPGDEGVPNRQGFDDFFGFLSQTHAHNHYPDYLWRNDARVALPNVVTPVGEGGGGYATVRKQYATDLFADESLKFVEANRERPFFLFLALTVPHANNERTRELKDGAEVPDYGPYAKEPWPAADKGQAAMITRMDAHIGKLLAHIKELRLDDRTLVMFSSDNGPHKEAGHDPERFDPNGPLSGYKRSLTDGGIRVPMIARWPGVIEPGRTSDHVGYFGDMMATCAELAGAKMPDGCDSISFLPTLLGSESRRQQAVHPYLYWEFHEGGASQQAVRFQNWKGIRTYGGRLALYDLATDIGETRDVAAEHPDVVYRIEEVLATAHGENADWPLKSQATGKRK
ncbi:MAG: N-acetylgalactosamine-6-sulfatase [Pirellula sp.]|nr:N-acetylgalactosamine-6-sulfatase [Pirellula sp.]